jgi:hypothetical protein
MQFLLGELAATLLASLIFVVLLGAAGAFFASALRLPGFDQTSGIERIGVAIVCALACLPILLDLAGRAGIWAMSGAWLAFAALGARDFARSLLADRARLGVAALALLAWALFAASLLVDWPTADGLRHSLLIGDYVKHVTATWAIEASGTPPYNPTVYTLGGHTPYYYFFYELTAVDAFLGRPFGIMPRHAAYAGAVFGGPALLALTWHIWKRSGADEAAGAPKGAPRALWLLVALLFTTGLDIFPALALNILRGDWSLTPDEWNDQVTSWFSTAMWVPHHLAGLCAAFVGLLALTRDADDAPAAVGWRRVLLAGLAFASMAGLSVYVAIGGALAAALWVLALARRRRWGDALAASASGVVALALAAWWISTLLVRAGSGAPPPVVFDIRPFPLSDIFIDPGPLRLLARAILVPIGYVVEFGIFLLGAVLFWRRAGRRAMKTDLGLVLVLATAASFFVGTFMRSAIIMNDLGWRVMLLAQVATLVWTLAAFRAGAFRASEPRRAAIVAIALGYLAVIDAALQMRYNPLMPFGQPTHLAERIAAWNWLDARLPNIAVVQENPDRSRAFDYGMYGRFPSAIADRHNGVLFGAPRPEVEKRLAEVSPVFTDAAMSPQAVRDVAARYGVAAIVLADTDPVFSAPDAWPQKTAPDFRNDFARVYLMKR